MPENYPEESIQHSEHGESLKSRKFLTSRHIVHITKYNNLFSSCSHRASTVSKHYLFTNNDAQLKSQILKQLNI
jgi:hypothetical protein